MWSTCLLDESQNSLCRGIFSGFVGRLCTVTSLVSQAALFLTFEPFDYAGIEGFLFVVLLGIRTQQRLQRHTEARGPASAWREKCFNAAHASRLAESAAEASQICEIDLSLARFYLASVGLKGRTSPSSEPALFSCTLTVGGRIHATEVQHLCTNSKIPFLQLLQSLFRNFPPCGQEHACFFQCFSAKVRLS